MYDHGNLVGSISDSGQSGLVADGSISYAECYGECGAGMRRCVLFSTDAGDADCRDCVPGGQVEWYDEDGPDYNCAWNASESACDSAVA